MPLKVKVNSALDKLAQKLKGKTIILGIGNTLRGDDGFGSWLAQILNGKISPEVYDVGIAPENFLGIIIKEKPDTILLVDAVDLGKEAGRVELLTSEEVKTKNFFLTHNLSPVLFIDFLKENTNSEIYLLAIQPKAINLEEKMSLEMESCLQELKLWFLERFSL